MKKARAVDNDPVLWRASVYDPKKIVTEPFEPLPVVTSDLIVCRENSVLVFAGKRTSGISKTEKLWTRWEGTSYIATWRSGVLRVYTRKIVNRRSSIREITADLRGHAFFESPIALAALYERHQGRGLPPMPDPTLVADFDVAPKKMGTEMVYAGAFPILTHAQRDEPWEPMSGFGKLLRLDNDRAFVEGLYGKSNYSRDLEKAVMQATLPAIFCTSKLRNIIRPSTLLEALAEPPHWAPEMLRRDLPALKKVFRTLSPATQRNLLVHDSYGIRDLTHIEYWLHDLGLEDKRSLEAESWKDLAGSLAVISTHTQGKDGGPAIKLSEFSKQADRTWVRGTFELRAARYVDDIIDWRHRKGYVGAMLSAVRVDNPYFGIYSPGGNIMGHVEVINVAPGDVRIRLNPNKKLFPADDDYAIFIQHFSEIIASIPAWKL